jgi:hypothetical protein
MKRSTDNSVHGAALAIVLVATFAMVLRAKSAGQTLWRDELWLLDVIRGGAAPAPVPALFLSLCRAATRAWGFSETALRLPALIGAGLTLLLPLALLRRSGLMGQLFAVAWTVFLAGSSPLAFYSVQLKQYTLDAALACIVIVAWLWFDERPDSTRRLAALAAATALAVSVSHPGIFLAAAVWPAALVMRVRAAAPGTRLNAGLRALASGAAVAALFATVHLFARTVVPDELRRYWSRRFWDGSLTFVVESTRHWSGHALNLLPMGTVLLGLSLVGFLLWGAGERLRRAVLIWVLIGPTLLCLGASGLRLYPYGEVRLMLFAIPGLLALLAAGIATLAAWRRVAGLAVFATLAAAFLYRGIARETYNATYMGTHDASEVNAVVRSLWRPGTAIVAHVDFRIQLAHYAPELVPSLTATAEEGGPMSGSSRTVLRVSQPAASAPHRRAGDVEVPLAHYRVVLSPADSTEPPTEIREPGR